MVLIMALGSPAIITETVNTTPVKHISGVMITTCIETIRTL